MIGSKRYGELKFALERTAQDNWHVWCQTGALQVLTGEELREWLTAHPGETCAINFANNSAAHIQPGDPLWQVLMELASEQHIVEVYPLDLSCKYRPWTGQDGDLGHFDNIKITAR